MKRTIIWLCTVASSSIASAQVEAPAGISNGGWGDVVAVELPSAPNGSEPKVSIRHDHRVPDGPLGADFVLMANSEITRHSATQGVPTHGDPDSESTFRIDGTTLYTTLPNQVAPTSRVGLDLQGLEFEQEQRRGDIIRFDVATNTWIREHAGWTWVYGESEGYGATKQKPEPVFDATGDQIGELPILCPMGGALCSTARWSVASITDPSGNRSVFDYQRMPLPEDLSDRFSQPYTEELALAAIEYVGGLARVGFDYEVRPDPRASFADGVSTVRAHRLNSIQVTTNGQVFSEYRLEYENDDTGDPEQPIHSLLSQIVRVAADGGPEQVVRTFARHHTTPELGEPATTAVGTPQVEYIGYGTSPFGFDVNRDGLTDLIALGYTLDSGQPEAAHRVYIASGDDAAPFISVAEAEGETLALIQELENVLGLYLPYRHVEHGRGYTLGDLDRDGNLDMLVEEVPASGQKSDVGDILIVEHHGGSTFRVSSHGDLPACALRFGQLFDVNGDGYPDLVRRDYDESGPCPAKEQTKWVANSAERPYLEWSTRVDLEMPHAPATSGGVVEVDLLHIQSIVCHERGGQFLPRLDQEDPLSGPDRISNFARFADWNGDGVTDVAYSFYSCFDHLINAGCGEWRPQTDLLFSKIYYGEGDGTFIDSGHEAGPPLVEHSFVHVSDSDDECRVVTNNRLLTSLDFDRNGYPELVSTSGGLSEAPDLHAAYDRGLTTGFGLASGSQPTDIATSDLPAGGDPVTGRYAFGDFDGDGFVDVATAGSNSVTVRPSTQGTSEGRITSSTNHLGGLTAIEWGFSASGENNNPDLGFNIEVLERVHGATGESILRYAGGNSWNAGFGGFAEVEMTNARGARTEYGFYTDVGRRGYPAYGVRYRDDDTIEHVTVYIVGTRASATQYTHPITPPYAPELLRQCDYDIGRPGISGAPPTLESLTEECHAVGDGLVWIYPYSTTDDGPNDDRYTDAPPNWWAATDEEAGSDPHCATDPTYGVAPGGDPAQAQCQPLTLAGLSWSSVATAELADAFLARRVSHALHLSDAIPDEYRWPIPNDIAVPVAPADSGPSLQFIDTELRAHVTDWFHDHDQQRLERTYDHRDVETTDDDLETVFGWEQPISGRLWNRLTSRKILDSSGQLWSLRERSSFDSNHFDRPGMVRECGKGGGGCRDTQYNWTATGSVESIVHSDNTSASSTYSWCGRLAEHTDEVGNTRVRSYDERCRLLSDALFDATTAFVYDGLNRVIERTTSPGGNQPGDSVRTLYDDALSVAIDSDFGEPRVASIRSSNRRLARTFQDEFGRTTRREICTAANSTASSIDDATCADDPVIESWTGYSNDGWEKATATAFATGELSPTTAFSRDAYGRIEATQSPAHTTGANWLTTTSIFGPGWTRVDDALGRVKVVRVSTLTTESEFGGQLQRREQRNAFGLPTLIEGPAGDATQLTYNDANQLTDIRTVASADCWQGAGAGALYTACNQGQTLHYDMRGRQIGRLDLDGVGWKLELDGIGRPLLKQHLDGAGSTATDTWIYDDAARPRLAVRTDEAGNRWQRELDGTGRLLARETRDPSGQLISVSQNNYSPSGRLLNHFDGNGLEHAFVYDALGYRLSESHPAVGTTIYESDGAGRVTTATDADGVSRHFNYNFSGSRRQTHVDDRLAEERRYDDGGLVIELFRNGVLARYDRDDFDRVIRIDHGVDQSGVASTWQTMSYDDRHRLTTRRRGPINGAFSQESWDYDEWNRVSVYTGPRGGQRLYEYDAVGRRRFTQDEESYRQETRYDSRGRVILQDTPGADPSEMRYATGLALAGQSGLSAVEVEDGEGSITTHYADGLGRPVQEQRGDGTLLGFEYAGAQLDRKVWYDSNGVRLREVRFDYDPASGQLTLQRGPAAPSEFGGTVYETAYGYTAAGRLQDVQSPGDPTSFAYDRFGLVESESYDGLVRQFHREEAGFWPSRVDLLGAAGVRTTQYERDAAARVTSISTSDPLGTTERQEFTGFDAFDRPQTSINMRRGDGGENVTHRWGYTLDGRVASRETLIDGASIGVSSWSYYANGVLESVTTPAGASTTYDYGASFDHALDKVRGDHGQVHTTISARNGRGQVLEMELEGSRRRFAYDALGRMKRRDTLAWDGSQESSWDASFDALGKMTSERFLDSAGVGWENTYSYDTIGRLTGELHGKSQTEVLYELDLAGNRLLTRTTDAEGSTETDLAYDGNRLISVAGVALEYNEFNEVVRDQRGYDYERSPSGRVLSITNNDEAPVTSNFRRDAFGLAIETSLSSGDEGTEHIHWRLDPSALPLEIATASGTDRYIAAEGRLIERVTSVAGTDVRKAALRDPGGTLDRFGETTLGDVTAFGSGPSSPSEAGPDDDSFLFHGMRSLSSAPAVHLARLRVYDPDTGRFLSPDPSGLKGGPHRYAYVMGDPVNYSDALGLEPVIVDGALLDLPATAIAAMIDVSAQKEPQYIDFDLRSRTKCPPGAICENHYPQQLDPILDLEGWENDPMTPGQPGPAGTGDGTPGADGDGTPGGETGPTEDGDASSTDGSAIKTPEPEAKKRFNLGKALRNVVDGLKSFLGGRGSAGGPSLDNLIRKRLDQLSKDSGRSAPTTSTATPTHPQGPRPRVAKSESRPRTAEHQLAIMPMAHLTQSLGSGRPMSDTLFEALYEDSIAEIGDEIHQFYRDGEPNLLRDFIEQMVFDTAIYDSPNGFWGERVVLNDDSEWKSLFEFTGPSGGERQRSYQTGYRFHYEYTEPRGDRISKTLVLTDGRPGRIVHAHEGWRITATPETGTLGGAIERSVDVHGKQLLGSSNQHITTFTHQRTSGDETWTRTETSSHNPRWDRAPTVTSEWSHTVAPPPAHLDPRKPPF